MLLIITQYSSSPTCSDGKARASVAHFELFPKPERYAQPQSQLPGYESALVKSIYGGLFSAWMLTLNATASRLSFFVNAAKLFLVLTSKQTRHELDSSGRTIKSHNDGQHSFCRRGTFGGQLPAMTSVLHLM